MNQKQIKAAVEAMLFAAGDPVSADKLAAAASCQRVSRWSRQRPESSRA